MNSLFNFKWLMATILLCTPMLMRGAENISLPMSNDSDLGSGWGESTYNGTTQTLTFVEGWTGRGWWLGSADYSDYAGVEVVFKSSIEGSLNLVTQYNYYDSYDEEGNGEGDALGTTKNITLTGDDSEEQTIYLEFDATMKDDVEQIYLQPSAAGTITLVSATVIANENAAQVASEYTLDFTAYSTANWKATVDEDAGVTTPDTITVVSSSVAKLVAHNGWGGMGWTNYWPGWDLSNYDAVVMTYEDLTSDSGNAYLQLFIQDGQTQSVSSTQAGTSAASGTIEYVIANHSGPDYTDITQIVVQPSAACTVTITSIKFVKYSTEGEGETESTPTGAIIVTTGHDYLNTAWSETNLDDESTTTMTTGSNGQSATITITEDTGGSIAWKYSGDEDTDSLNLAADYTGITVTYSFGSNEDDNQTEEGTGEGTDGDDNQTEEPSGTADEPDGETADAATITLVVTDSDNNTASITGSDGSISCDFSSITDEIDFSKVTQIAIKADAACTINITSIELVLWLGDSSTSNENYIITKTVDSTTSYYLNLGVGMEIWSGSDALDASGNKTGNELANSDAATILPTESDEDGVIAADVNYKGYWCGVKWSYPDGVDLTTNSLSQLVITYRVAQKNTNETPQIVLDLYDGNGNHIQVSGADATGTITCIYSNYEDEIDFTNITSMAIQAEVPCTLHILSAELQKGGTGTVVDQEMLLSQFYVWGDDDYGNTYTYDEDSDTGTIVLNHSWTGGVWYLDDVDEDSYFGVYIKLKTTATCKIRLTVVYVDSDETQHFENYAIDGSGDNSEQWLFLPFDKDYDKDVFEIQLMCGDLGDDESCTITLLSAELVGPDDGEVNDNIRRIKTATNEGYGTYCCDKDFEMPEYLDGYIITAVAYEKSSTSEPDVKEDTDTGSEDNTDDGNNAKARVKKLAEGDEESVDEGDETDSDEYDFSEGYYITIKKAYAHDTEDGKYSSIVPAGVAILVKGCGDDPGSPLTYTAYVDGEGESNYVATDDDKAMADGNLLLGNSGQNTMSSSEMESKTVEAYSNEYAASDFYYFYLDYGKITPMTNYTEYEYLGFYWMNGAATEGGAFDMIANRAWLPLLKSHFTDSEGNPISLKIIEYVEEDSEEQTTGITTVPAETAESVSNGAVYTIQGVRVNNMNKPGVYIVDGKKVIKK